MPDIATLREDFWSLEDVLKYSIFTVAYQISFYLQRSDPFDQRNIN